MPALAVVAVDAGGDDGKWRSVSTSGNKKRRPRSLGEAPVDWGALPTLGFKVVNGVEPILPRLKLLLSSFEDAESLNAVRALILAVATRQEWAAAH